MAVVRADVPKPFTVGPEALDPKGGHVQGIAASVETAGGAAYDVAVMGGGPAGVCAAIAAARNGAKTFLVERGNCLWDDAGTGRSVHDVLRQDGRAS